MSTQVITLVDAARINQHWLAKHKEECPQEVLVTTKAFKDEVDGKWQSKQAGVIHKIEEVTGLEVTGTFNVFILPPELDEAQYLDKETIEWGYRELYENSIVIGIAHELIHCITHDFYSTVSDDDKWSFHALVYLSADEEIRHALNGDGEYFDSPILTSFHSRLIETARNVLPYWKKYIANQNGRSIIDLFKEIKSEY